MADATVMTAQDSLASSALSAQLATREALLERAVGGEATLQMLAQIQGFLSSNPADCATLSAYTHSVAASVSLRGEESGIAYALNASSREVSQGLPVNDNLTLVAPFAGAAAGSLNLVEYLSVKEAGGQVTLHREETHYLKIPISPEAASFVCSTSMAALASALSVAPCNATLEQAAFASALGNLVAVAAGQGFSLTAGWDYSGVACSVAYWVTLVQPGVAGPSGSFDWTVSGHGTA